MTKQFTHQWNTQRARIYRLSKESGWIVVGQIFTVFGMLALVRILTEYLTPTEYGELTLGLTIAGLVNQVVMGGITNGIGRFYSISAEKGDLSGYLRASWQLTGFATLAVTIIAVALISGLFSSGNSHWIGLAIAVLVFSLFSGYNSNLNSIQNAARQRAVVALHNGLDAWLKIGLATGFIIWLGSNSTAVVIGYILSSFVITTSQLFFLKQLMNRKSISRAGDTQGDWVQQIWQFSWPFSIFGIFTWAQQVSDRWALEHFSTTHEVGQYAVVFQLGYAPIGILTGLMMTLIGPILYFRSGAATDHLRNTSVHKITWRITQVCLIITVMAFIFTWFLHGWIFQWFVADTYRNVSHFLPWVVLAGGLFSAGQMLSLKLMSEIRPKSLLKVKIGTAILGIVVNVLGAWLYGTRGVVYALILFSTIYLLWMIFLASHMPDCKKTTS